MIITVRYDTITSIDSNPYIGPFAWVAVKEIQVIPCKLLWISCFFH